MFLFILFIFDIVYISSMAAAQEYEEEPCHIRDVDWLTLSNALPVCHLARSFLLTQTRQISLFQNVYLHLVWFLLHSQLLLLKQGAIELDSASATERFHLVMLGEAKHLSVERNRFFAEFILT